MTLSQAYAVQHGTTVLAGLTQLDSNFGAEPRADASAGSPFPQFAVVSGVRPRLQFSTRAVDAALTLVGTTGVAISTENPLKAVWAQLENGSPKAGNVHNIYTYDRGLLVPRRLSVSHRQDASLDLEAIVYSSDGAIDPLVETLGPLPTIVRDNIRYTLKSATVGNVSTGCLIDVAIDFGVQADTLGCKSDVYDSSLTLDNGVTPTITLTTLKTDVAIALEGLVGTHLNTSIVLRKYDPTGILFASSDDDITITAAGVVTRDTHSGSGRQRSQLGIRITCAWDGTNAPIVIA